MLKGLLVNQLVYWAIVGPALVAGVAFPLFGVFLAAGFVLSVAASLAVIDR